MMSCFAPTTLLLLVDGDGQWTNEAPETAPVADVETFCTPEWARKAARKFEKNGRLLLDILSDSEVWLSLLVLYCVFKTSVLPWISRILKTRVYEARERLMSPVNTRLRGIGG